LKEPFCFARDNPDDYSVVERTTLRALGVDRYDFKPATERRRIVPERLKIQNKMMEEEKKRLAKLQESTQSVTTLEADKQTVAAA